MTNGEYFQSLIERQSHHGTMRPLSPLEGEQLRDYERHMASLTLVEREVFNSIIIG